MREEKKTNRERTRILTNKVQVKYALMLGGVLILLLALTQVYTLMFLRSILPNIFSAEIGLRLRQLQWHLLIIGMLYNAVIVFMSIYVTHRIVGPVYRIEADAKKMADSPELDFRFKIRKNDEFQDVVTSLNAMLEKLQQRAEQQSS